jgi:ParB/RepB/Spo0J family partition protein
MATTTKPEVLVINANEITPNQVALRGVNKEDEDYQNLLSSIKAQGGVITPISVRRKNDGQKDFYELIDGLQRYSCCCDAGITLIPANILTMDDAEVLEAQVLANVHRVETRPVEYSKQLCRILGGNPTMTITELATKLAKSPTWVSARLGLLKLDKGVGSLVDEGKVNLSNAYALAKLPVEEQVAFVDRAQTMKPNEFVPLVQARVKEVREARRQGKKAGAAEFVPVAHLQKISILKAELTDPTIIPSLIAEYKPKNAVDAAKLALQWVLNMDPKSVEASKIRYEQSQKAKEEAKQRRAAEREKDKAKKAAANAAEIEANMTPAEKKA